MNNDQVKQILKETAIEQIKYLPVRIFLFSVISIAIDSLDEKYATK